MTSYTAFGKIWIDFSPQFTVSIKREQSTANKPQKALPNSLTLIFVYD